MAKLRKNELKNLTVTQLEEKIKELKKELMKISAQISVGTTLQNPGQPKVLKKTIARIHTFITQKKQEGGNIEKNRRQ